MPVLKCSNGKYRIGTGPCVYESQEKAERAQVAMKAQLSEHAFRTTPIKLSEAYPMEGVSAQVQLMRTCTFYHEKYGKVEITRQLFSEMIENHNKGTRGIEVMIDYSHNSDLEAAGWVKNLHIKEVQLAEANPELGTDEKIEYQLWADVEWTPVGRKKLADKEFAYLSADFDPNYKDNENPTQSYGAVLLGAGLTNRPVIKRMNPAIQLSEFSQTKNQENGMTFEEIQKKLDKTKIKLSESEEKLEAAEKKFGDAEKSLADSEVKLAKIDELMRELGVDSLEALMSKIAEMKQSNVELAEEKEKTEKETRLNVLLSEGKISQAQKEKALKLEKESFDGFIELAEMNEKVVKLDEEGSGKAPKSDDKTDDVEAKVLELAEKKATEEEVEMVDAISMVLSEDKELAQKYYQLGE